ncbi:MAG: ArsR family transcriptional regulator, partial [Verrucomicrobiaceae bacterium]
MPKQQTLRHFKAALFETLSHRTRMQLLLQLAEGEKEVRDLMQASPSDDEVQTGKHLATLVGNRIVQRRTEGGQAFYSLTDPALGKVVRMMAVNDAWPMALSHPIRIEILEMLQEEDVTHSEIVRRLSREDQPQAPLHLDKLLSTTLVTRRSSGPQAVYTVNRDIVPKVLKLLREYFENHLAEAILMVNRVSYQHIQEEAEHLRQHPH